MGKALARGVLCLRATVKIECHTITLYMPDVAVLEWSPPLLMQAHICRYTILFANTVFATWFTSDLAGPVTATLCDI